MDEGLCWTYLSGAELARKMIDFGVPICTDTARAMLDEAGLGKRKIKKPKAMGKAENRNEQFEKIARLRAEFERKNLPVISIDIKKKSVSR